MTHDHRFLVAPGYWDQDQAEAKRKLNEHAADSSVHFGKWYGGTLPHHGLRSNQSRIIDSGDREWFTNETPDDVEIGSRVTFKVGCDPKTCEQVAVEVTAVEPVKVVEEPKVVKRSKA